jgi:hypothetical protein
VCGGCQPTSNSKSCVQRCTDYDGCQSTGSSESYTQWCADLKKTEGLHNVRRSQVPTSSIYFFSTFFSRHSKLLFTCYYKKLYN